MIDVERKWKFMVIQEWFVVDLGIHYSSWSNGLFTHKNIIKAFYVEWVKEHNKFRMNM